MLITQQDKVNMFVILCIAEQWVDFYSHKIEKKQFC